MKEGYVKCIGKMMDGAIAWIRKNGVEGLEFRVPPDNVGFMSDLPPAIPRLANTDAARRFLRALEDAAPGEGTAIQAILIITMLDLPTIPWNQGDYDGLQTISRGGVG